MSVVSAPSSSSYRNQHRSRATPYRPPAPSGNNAFSRLRYDQDRGQLLPHSKSFDKNASYRERDRDQDDRGSVWDGNDNSTVVSGCTSVCSYSALVTQQKRLEQERKAAREASLKPSTSGHCCCLPSCAALCKLNYAAIASLLVILAVPVMILFPFIGPKFGFDWPGITVDSNSECYLIVIGFGWIIHVIAAYRVHSRKACAKYPRIVVSRTVFTLGIIFALTCFGLFYIAIDVMPRNPNYQYILLHALLLLILSFLIHTLLYLYEIRQPYPHVTVYITRDPDGETHAISIQKGPIQEACTEILSKYASTFSGFNPYKFRAKKEGVGAFKLHNGMNPVVTGFKVYAIEDFDGSGASEQNGVISVANAKTLIQAAVRRGRRDRTDNFHQIMDFQKKVEKKKSDLVMATEEAFAHVNAINANNAKFNVKPMDPGETAKLILGVIGRPLLKYLKLTQQHNFYLLPNIEDHLRECLRYGFTADTFLQQYFGQRVPVEEPRSKSKWSILSGLHPTNTIDHGHQFVLRCLDNDLNNNIRLLCRVEANPVFNIVQERHRNAFYTYNFSNAHGSDPDSPV
uniref:RGS domain-containing protein n=1 Tax=Panagrellus redivivus TaxID=6233 RepID=A0A7E4ZV72_PANRE